MPTYTYQCQTCGVQFEKVQSFSDKPLTRCPECRKGHVRRVVQPAAIVFKGSGWYKTDSRSSSSSTLSSPSSKSAKTAETDKPSKADKVETPAKKESTASDD
jgi:putative FmdB family regulatory protein